VVVAGYAIEMNTAYFGAGDQSAPGARQDAVFTWLHQDIGLFLLPTLVVIMLAVEHLIVRGRRPGWIGWTTIVGTTVAFIGSMIYVFVTPTLHGAGYVVTTIGLLIVGVALLATVWWGASDALRPPMLTPPTGSTTLPRTAPIHPVTPPPAPVPATPEREGVPVGIL
jgi:hypothetical protein